MRIAEPAEAKTAPFDLGPAKPKATVLLVHGFTGSPWDVRPLGEALAAAGYRVKGIRLPGHGGVTEATDAVGWQDWEHAVEDALFRLSEEGPVHLARLSMGALLATVMA